MIQGGAVRASSDITNIGLYLLSSSFLLLQVAMIQGGAVRASSDYTAGSDFTMDHLFKEFAFDCNQGEGEEEEEGGRETPCV